MAKCNICGYECDTKFCGSCGAPMNTTNENTNQSPFFSFGFNGADLGKAMGGFEELNKAISSPEFKSFIDGLAAKMPPNFKAQQKTAPEDAEKKRTARLAILNKICPNCGRDFTEEETCPTCNTSLKLTDYN